MTVILRKLPYFDCETALEFHGQRIRVKPDQIIVWISIIAQGLDEWHPETARLPAILDTGCNHNLVIRHDQLLSWAGVHPASLGQSGRVRILGREAAQLSANVWLHRNVPGERDQLSHRAPFLLELTQGIAVLPQTSSDDFPRLPLLGLRALRWGKLHVHIDSGRCRVTLRRERSLFGLR